MFNTGEFTTYPFIEDELPCVVEQNAGDIFFVPGMWSHQVCQFHVTFTFHNILIF
jgi:hypothetical protein